MRVWLTTIYTYIVGTTLPYNMRSNQHTVKELNRRNIIWFNPPYSKHVATNIGRQFLNIIAKVLHPKHPLRKIFNRNTLILSYSCMPNIMCKINRDNKRNLASQMTSSLTTTSNTKRTYKCKRKSNCPLNGKWLLFIIIYQATITSPNNSNTYIGLCETDFKIRLYNHTCFFKHKRCKNATKLSKHIWYLKDKDTHYKIKWKIINHALSYNPNSKRCKLCILEKFYIICKPSLCTLNKIS